MNFLCKVLTVLWSVILINVNEVELRKFDFGSVVGMTNHFAKQTLKFSWKDCGSTSYPSRIGDISLSPDPMHLPGNVNIGFSGSLNINLTAPIKFEVELKKKVVFWITVPCIDNVGSCTYDDGCQILALLKCPPIFQQHDLPCYCPIKSGSYKLPASPFYIDDSAVPSFLTHGSYQVTVKASKGGEQVACVYMEFSIA